MKIVKSHKNRSAHSEAFGVWSGKTLNDIQINEGATAAQIGTLNDQIIHVKIGSGDAFIWFDDLDEVERLGDRLKEIGVHARKWRKS